MKTCKRREVVQPPLVGFLLSAALVTLVGCTLAPTPEPAAVAQAVAATLTAMPTATPTPYPTPTPPPPTPTPTVPPTPIPTPTFPPPTPTPTASPTPVPAQPLPQPPPTPAPQRVRFAPGTASATWTAYLTAGVPQSYVLWALAGQQMAIVTTNVGVTVALLAPGGGPLASIAQTAGEWYFLLPKTGDYTLVLLGEGSTAVTVTIPPLPPTPEPTVAATPTPTRIEFAPGTASYEFTTTLVPGVPRAYVLRVLAGQRMYISALGEHDAAVVVLGADGVPLLTFRGGRPGEWFTDIPATGDYTVVLYGAGETHITFYVPPL